MSPSGAHQSDSPAPSDNQTEVLLLGTYHMDNPGLDAITVEADDVLTASRQRELSELTDRLANWQPDVVAVERPADRQDELDEFYEGYRSGEIEYHEETEIEPTNSSAENEVSSHRSEVIQIGFRLAERLGHDRVWAVDHPMSMRADFDEDELTELDLDLVQMQERARNTLDVNFTDPERVQREISTHLRESSITEHLRFLNRDELLQFNHELMFGGLLVGAEEPHVGSRMLSTWYERNIHIVANLWRVTHADTDRIFLLFGNGHIKILEHLLSEAPMFRPLNALEVLKEK